jgi:predicted RecA/RadA family phage recombinase
MEILNGGLTFKVMFPIEENPGIDMFVNQEIMIKSSEFVFVGKLLKIASKNIKQEGDISVFKEATVLIDNIAAADYETSVMYFPDKKDEFMEEIKIVYGSAMETENNSPEDEE